MCNRRRYYAKDRKGRACQGWHLASVSSRQRRKVWAGGGRPPALPPNPLARSMFFLVTQIS